MGTEAAFAPSEVSGVRPAPSVLLGSTPPSIVRALSVGYPLLKAADRLLGWLTWTSADRYEPALIAVLWWLLIEHFDAISMYLLPLGIAIGVLFFSDTSSKEPPTIENIVALLEQAGERFHLLADPFMSLNLSGGEKARLVLATMFMSPFYIIGAYMFLTPRSSALWAGMLILTWNSLWFRVMRSVAFRFRLVRGIVFLVTGIDRSPAKVAFKASQERNATAAAAAKAAQLGDENTIKFTFVLYENQRHWLGIGWTGNMLPEERAAWTDKSQNEAQPVESFELPDSEGTGLTWKWVDPAWQVDLSNDGLLSSERKFTSQPGENDGYVYYNNMWKSPSATATFSKYTRRRRWVRRAALVTVTDDLASNKAAKENGKRDA